MYRVDAHLNKNNLFCRIKSAHVFGSCFIQILKSKVVTPGPLMLSCAQYSMINSSKKTSIPMRYTMNEKWIYEQVFKKRISLKCNDMEDNE